MKTSFNITGKNNIRECYAKDKIEIIHNLVNDNINNSKENIKILNKLKDTGAEIVISSSWGEDVEKARKILTR